jgi:hypothetical protein
MRRHRWVLLASCAVWAGCATGGGAFDRHFDEGRYHAAVEAGEGDPGVRGSESGLYRLALAHLVPGTGVHDPLRAEGLLNELLASYPAGERALEARILADQLAATRRADLALHRARYAADSVRAELSRLTELSGALEVRAHEGSQELERLRGRVRVLEGDLEARQEEVAGLQRTLDELKRIDMRRSGGTQPPVPIAPGSSNPGPR